MRLKHFREVVRKDINHVIFPDGKELFAVNLLNELKSKRGLKGNYAGSSSSSPNGAEHLFDSSNERLIQIK